MDLDYPKLLDTIEQERALGRTESHALLLWFLKNYYRLDEIDAVDAVCDGPDDKGIDGIYVDENLERVDVFQCKLVQNPERTLGDTQLKEFVGTLTQLHEPAKIGEIADTTSNVELRNALYSENVAQKVADGFTIHGVFITNIPRDGNAEQFLKTREDITLFDKLELEASYVYAGPTKPIGKQVEFDVFGFDTSDYQVGDSRIVFAPLKATELVSLDGIASNELFAWNVRGSLGRTKVNKDIGKSIDNPDEHKHFLLFHNGLTLLCEDLETGDDKIRVSGYSVVNGCQSLTSLYDHRTKLTDELRIMARLIQLAPGSYLADKITHHSNNQNPINARDLQSNSAIQRRLQREFEDFFQNSVVYRIKRGEADGPDVTIDNDEAGRLLLAFDLKQPWTCHQTYRILDELHGDIYARPEVNAQRIFAIYIVGDCVVDNLDDLENKLLASYRLTRYLLIYLVRLALDGDEVGERFCRDPGAFVSAANGPARIAAAITHVVKDLIVDLNAEVRDRQEQGKPLDFKRELKSPNSIREISRGVIPQYQKAVNRGRASSFGVEWDASARTD